MQIAPTVGTHAQRLASASFKAGRLWKESDTGLVYLDTGSLWTPWNPHGQVVKGADQTLTPSSTSLQDVTGLTFPIEAGEAWQVGIFLILTGTSVNADFKFGLTVPTGSTGQWGANVAQNTSGINGGWVVLPTGSNPNSGAALSTTIAIGSGSATHTALFWAIIQAGGTSNPFQFRASQNTAVAEDNKILKNSNCLLRRLS